MDNFDVQQADFAFEDARGSDLNVAENFNEGRRLRRAVKRQNLPRNNTISPEVLTSLPSRAVCEDLVACYLRTFQPIYRIVDVIEFRREFDRFWVESNSDREAFTMELLLILALGSTFHIEATETQPPLKTHAPTWISTAQAWLTGPSERSTMNLGGVQVYCLLVLARQATYICPGPTWISTSSLLSTAMSIGLHRDPGLFKSLSVREAEMRKRVWAAVVELAIQAHIDAPVQLLLTSADFDTSAPLNLNDEDLSLHEKGADLVPRIGITDSSLQIQLCKSQSLRLDIARSLNDLSQPDYNTVLRLGENLRSATRELSVFFRDASAKQNTFIDFHRRLLDILMHRMSLLLYRSHMVASKSEPRFYLARKLCVDSATAIISHSGDTMKGGSSNLLLLASVGRGIFKGPFDLNAILVVILELFSQIGDAGSLSSADTLDQLQRSNRKSLMSHLEKVKDGLYALIREKGSVSLKAYFILSLLLSVAKEAEEGRSMTRGSTARTLDELLRGTLEILRRHPGLQFGGVRGIEEPGVVGDGGFDDTLLSLFRMDEWVSSPGHISNSSSSR